MAERHTDGPQGLAKRFTYANVLRGAAHAHPGPILAVDLSRTLGLVSDPAPGHLSPRLYPGAGRETCPGKAAPYLQPLCQHPPGANLTAATGRRGFSFINHDIAGVPSFGEGYVRGQPRQLGTRDLGLTPAVPWVPSCWW